MINEEVIGKAYLGPPTTHEDHKLWQSNILNSDCFFMSHVVDGGSKGVIIVFSMKHLINVSFDTLFDYICEKGTIHGKLIENTWEFRNPRIGIHSYFRGFIERS